MEQNWENKIISDASLEEKEAEGLDSNVAESVVGAAVLERPLIEVVEEAAEEEREKAVEAVGDTLVSVVIPAYNEEKRIGPTLLDVDRFLSERHYKSEILVVIDGAKDNTFKVVRKYQEVIRNLRIINNPENHGKGYVVRQGLLEAKGKYRLFMDADNSTTVDHLDKFLPALEEGADIVIGSRDLKGSQVMKHQPKWKEIMGDMGNLLIQFVAGLWGFPDTQCGFKILKAAAVEKVAPKMLIDRWGFDIEMLFLAKKMGLKIQQLPVVWKNDENTTVSVGGYVNTLKELFQIRWNYWMNKYGEL